MSRSRLEFRIPVLGAAGENDHVGLGFAKLVDESTSALSVNEFQVNVGCPGNADQVGLQARQDREISDRPRPSIAVIRADRRST